MPKYALALPNAGRGWCLYSGRKVVKQGRELHEVVAKRSDVLVGLPCSMTSTFSVRLPTTDSSLFDDMVFAQIEKRGLAARGDSETIFDYEIVEQTAGESELAVHVLEPELPEDLIIPRAAGYAPAATLRERPEDGCGLWREHRRLAMAVFRDGQMIHSQLLSSTPEISSSAAQELNLSLLALESESTMEDSLPKQCDVWIDDLAEDQREGFAKALNIPARFHGAPTVSRRPRSCDRLIPAPVQAARKRRRALQRNLFLVCLGVVAYALVGLWAWQKAKNTRAEIASLEQRIAILEPDVQRIQQSELRWEQLKPAFDLNYFPIVQLSRITGALPGSGVVVREFRTASRNIRIRGQARDVQLANRLVEDLNAMEEFAMYEWNMPNPKVEQNNTATFEIEGRSKDEGID